MTDVTFIFPSDATAETRSVPVYPLILGVVPELDNKTKSVVSVVKVEGIVTVPANTFSLLKKIIIKIRLKINLLIK